MRQPRQTVSFLGFLSVHHSRDGGRWRGSCLLLHPRSPLRACHSVGVPFTSAEYVKGTPLDHFWFLFVGSDQTQSFTYDSEVPPGSTPFFLNLWPSSTAPWLSRQYRDSRGAVQCSLGTRSEKPQRGTGGKHMDLRTSSTCQAVPLGPAGHTYTGHATKTGSHSGST